MCLWDRDKGEPVCYVSRVLPFFLPEPVAFRRVYGLEAYSRTSRESNHHRQSVSAVKNDALPTEPRGHLSRVLPFGASASVHHFLRVSAFLHLRSVFTPRFTMSYYFPFATWQCHCWPLDQVQVSVRMLPVRLALCDLEAPGWREPWFPHCAFVGSWL